MAKRRTKKQKRKVSQMRQKRKSENSDAPQPKTQNEKKKQTQKSVEKGTTYDLASSSLNKKLKQKANKSLLRVDPKYLKLDLVRSVIITCILVAALIGIYLYMRYN